MTDNARAFLGRETVLGTPQVEEMLRLRAKGICGANTTRKAENPGG
jgi:hypothetical protein